MGERGFYPELESLRGIAAAMVALLHVLQAQLSVDGTSTTLMNASWSGLRVLGNGAGGVVFFFVLSGFVLSHQLSRLPGDWADRCRTFLIGRLFRIYPAVWATLTIFVAIYLLTGMGLTTAAVDYKPSSLLQHALLFTTHINGVMWTLQTELLAVPVVLLLFIAAHRYGAAALIAGFLLFACLSFTGHWNKLFSMPLLQPMYAFVAGMLAWKTSHRYRGVTGWWLAFAAIGFLFTRPLISWGSNWSMITESVLAGIIIAMLVANPHLGRTAGLTSRILRYYGRISYSFFLLHPLSLIVIWSISGPLTSAVEFGISPTLLGVGLFIASVLVITPIAHLQYLLIERGGITLGRRLTLRVSG